MEVDAEVMQTYPCFHCIEKDKRIAELEETNRAYKDAWSVNILTERIDQLEPFCERFVNAYPDWRDEYEALGEAK